MDVHPVSGSIHTWRDFFIHLTIISVGLLIALGLEGIVGWTHDMRLVHRAEANLKSELHENRTTLASNSKMLDSAERQAETDLAVLSGYKSTHHSSGDLKFYWEWNSLASAAWDAARVTGAVALMDYGRAQKYSEIYAQQSLVNLQASSYIRDVYRSAAPLEGGRRLSDLQPAELDAMISSVQQTMADLNFLRDLSDGLSRNFERENGSKSP
ncbi:MAG TPA: hypothetical protein VJO35_14330 [Terriglobales bacterium]|nr:hypothetical protein [Terriglobales bacterium]